MQTVQRGVRHFDTARASGLSFATSVQGNPSFILVAFSPRLADHLDRSLRPAAVPALGAV
jgi:hypothetical protein